MAGYTVSCYLHYLCKKTKAPMQYLLAGYFILYVSTASQPLGKREKLLDNFGQMRSTLPQLAGYKLWLPSASIALLLSLTFAQNTNQKHIFLCSLPTHPWGSILECCIRIKLFPPTLLSIQLSCL